MKPTDITLAQLIEAQGLDPALVAAFDLETTAGVALDSFREAGRGLDCVRLLVHVGEPRRTVWWGQRCLAGAGAELVDDEEQRELALSIEHWLSEPTDELRRDIGRVADELGYADPVSCLGLGVFLAEGSLAPPDIETVPPPPGVAARAIGGALTLHCVTTAPAEADALALEFIDAGLELLECEPPWGDFQLSETAE